MSQDITTPRLLYKGPANEFAETCAVNDQAGLDKALKEGWRLKRVDEKHAHKPVAAPATVAIPAQTLQTSASTLPVAPAKTDPPAKKK